MDETCMADIEKMRKAMEKMATHGDRIANAMETVAAILQSLTATTTLEHRGGKVVKRTRALRITEPGYLGLEG